MDIKEQILVALGLDKKINLEWQAKSDDGTIFVSTAEELEAGVDISVLTEDGTTIPLPAGTYKTDTGVSFRVEEEGIVAEVIESETEEEIEAAEEDECPNGVDDEGNCIEEEKTDAAEVEDWEGMEKRIQNLEDAVADLKGDKVEAEEEEKDCPNGYDDDGNCVEEEELKSPSKRPRKTKTTIVDEFAALKLENKKLKKQIAKNPSASPLNTNKHSKAYTQPTKQQLGKMTKKEKFIYNLNN